MLNRKGQNTAEYAILLALVVAVAVGVQTYIKRGVQARMREESKKLTTMVSSGAITDWATIDGNIAASMVAQWEPLGVSRQSTQKIVNDTVTSSLSATGAVTREVNKTTSQAIGDFQRYRAP